MITLNYRDTRPIYEQVCDELRKLIVCGALQEGEKLPSVRVLAAELAINPNTIQRAYNTLEAEGYCCCVAGKGNFASLPKNDARKKELCRHIREVVAELRVLGVTDAEIQKLCQEDSQ